MLDIAQVEKALPATLRGAATQSLVDTINQISADPLVAEVIRDNFISYAHVLRDGKFKTEDYVHAVAYVSYKLMGNSNQDAYFKTFPQRYSTLVSRGATPKDISAYVAAYNKGKLVNLILEQTLVPVWILNQDVYQKAINTQAHLMVNAQSELVRTNAANSILTHLAKPKEVAGKLTIAMEETNGMKELTDLMRQLAQKQLGAIERGVTAKEIAAQRIIEVEVEDADQA
jgi:hypothetical protein